MADMIMIGIYAFIPLIAVMFGSLYLSVRYTNKKYNQLKEEIIIKEAPETETK